MRKSSLLLSAFLCLNLSGCVVAAVADLAATTVLTAGKLAVKGTGALIDAAIPDGDDEDEDKARRPSEKDNGGRIAQRQIVSQPIHYPPPDFEPNTQIRNPLEPHGLRRINESND